MPPEKKGHKAKDCTNDSVPQCKNCHEYGHEKSECPDRYKDMDCKECNQKGHRAADCPTPLALSKCHSCQQVGHIAVDLPTYGNKYWVCQSTLHGTRSCPHRPKAPAEGQRPIKRAQPIGIQGADATAPAPPPANSGDGFADGGNNDGDNVGLQAERCR